MTDEKSKSTVTVDRSLLREINMRKYEKGYSSVAEVLENELQFLDEDEPKEVSN
jgi:hypothetical protein